MKRGTIVLSPFPFTDLKGNKVRPALVVSSTERKGDDTILALISSNVDARKLIPTDYALFTANPFFRDTGLKVDSIFKMDRLITVKKEILLGEIGFAGKELMNILDEKLLLAIGLI